MRRIGLAVGARPLSEQKLAELVAMDEFATDTIALRQRPIIRLSRTKYLVLDARFVAELVSSQMYWMLFDSLGSEQRKYLRDLWGRLFELYLSDVLAHYYPREAGLLQTDVRFNDGQIDALLDFGEVVIVFEFKASLLLRSARFSRDPTTFEEEIGKKFGVGLRQLANASQAILDGRIKTATVPQRPMRVFPVLVADEAALQSLGVNRYVNDLFQKLLISITDRHAIRPVTVISVAELEEFLPYADKGLLKWPQILEERFVGNEVALESVHQMIYSHHRHDNMPLLRNDFLLAEFKVIWESMIATFRTAAKGAGSGANI